MSTMWQYGTGLAIEAHLHDTILDVITDIDLQCGLTSDMIHRSLRLCEPNRPFGRLHRGTTIAAVEKGRGKSETELEGNDARNAGSWALAESVCVIPLEMRLKRGGVSEVLCMVLGRPKCDFHIQTTVLR